MKMVVEHFVTFLLLLIFLWVGLTYVIQNMIHTNARDYHNAIISQIEDSNFNDWVILKCEEQAKKDGFQLVINQFEKDENRDGRVTLKYTYTIPIIQVKKQYAITGYAR